jgi:hypothetical protein
MKIMHQRFVLHQPAYSTRSAHDQAWDTDDLPVARIVLDGGLLSYGTSLRNSYREMAGYVGRVLNGAKTTDLPVQQPSTFELVLNLNAAKALALTIPTSILLRADEVIEQPDAALPALLGAPDIATAEDGLCRFSCIRLRRACGRRTINGRCLGCCVAHSASESGQSRRFRRVRATSGYPPQLTGRQRRRTDKPWAVAGSVPSLVHTGSQDELERFPRNDEEWTPARRRIPGRSHRLQARRPSPPAA